MGDGAVTELTKGVLTPREDRTIRFQRQAVCAPCGDGYDSTTGPEANHKTWTQVALWVWVTQLAC